MPESGMGESKDGEGVLVMGWFQKTFGKKEERPALTHPADLRKGDLITFAVTPLDVLSMAQATVEAVQTLDYGEGEERSFLLRVNNLAIGLSIPEDEEGMASLQISRKLKREEVLTLFDGDAFGAVFEEGAAPALVVQACPDGLTQWIDPESYRETVDCLTAIFYEADRKMGETGYPTNFDYYELVGKDSDFRIEIEVYDGGDTEVYACRRIPLHSIDSLWPAGS